MDMQWWHWAVLGLALGLLELATPGGFFILFFGIGALLVSVLVMLGIAGPLWLQWTLFPVLSVSVYGAGAAGTGLLYAAVSAGATVANSSSTLAASP